MSEATGWTREEEAILKQCQRLTRGEVTRAPDDWSLHVQLVRALERNLDAWHAEDAAALKPARHLIRGLRALDDPALRAAPSDDPEAHARFEAEVLLLSTIIYRACQHTLLLEAGEWGVRLVARHGEALDLGARGILRTAIRLCVDRLDALPVALAALHQALAPHARVPGLGAAPPSLDTLRLRLADGLAGWPRMAPHPGREVFAEAVVHATFAESLDARHALLDQLREGLAAHAASPTEHLTPWLHALRRADALPEGVDLWGHPTRGGLSLSASAGGELSQADRAGALSASDEPRDEGSDEATTSLLSKLGSWWRR